MGWASRHIAALLAGQTVHFRPRGHSMTGRVADGQRVTVAPISEWSSVKAGDVVLCKVHGVEYLHLVKAVEKHRALISNNHGKVNGWTAKRNVFGRLTATYDDCEGNDL